MAGLNRQTFKSTFTVVCVIVVAFMVGYWFYKYKFEDRDIGVVDYAMLVDVEDVEFPAVSLCFENPFIDANLTTMNSNVSKRRYLDYLEGSFFDEVAQQIDYTKVTLDLVQYFLGANAGYRNETGQINFIEIDHHDHMKLIHHAESFNGFNIVNSFLKCFTMRYKGKNHRKIKFLQLGYNKTGLLADWQSSSWSFWEHSVQVIVHHPGQFLIDYDTNLNLESINFDHLYLTDIYFTE